jgi:hypothetical protein
MNEMSDPNSHDSIARSIRRLSLAVWALVAVTAASIIASWIPFFAPSLFSRGLTATLPESSDFAVHSQSAADIGFSEWPLDKQIERASVIAVAKWQRANGTLKCVISEILKKTPNTTFYYKVGDEYQPANHAVRDDISYGDGQIMFFIGSPATFRFSTTYANNRIGGMGDMPISELREAIQKQR